MTKQWKPSSARRLRLLLKSTSGNQGAASKLLGITRTTLRTKIKKLGIAIERVIHSDKENVHADTG